MRGDRLLSILLVLQVQQRVTARELAQRLEVSERTIHRDMNTLSASGVPVTAERGGGGGWSLLEAYRTDLTGLSVTEIQALFVGKPAHLLSDLGLNGAGEAGLIKLLAALPGLSRGDAEKSRNRIHVDAAGWQKFEENIACLPLLHQAVWRERRVRFIYRRGDGNDVERVADPLGLVAKGKVWYLVAMVEGETRTYRVSRVQRAWLTDEPCRRPRDFDLPAYWEKSAEEFKGIFPRYLTTVRALPEAVAQLQGAKCVRIEHTGPTDAAGWVTLCVDFEVQEYARDHALRLGPKMEIVEPQELRAEVTRVVQQMSTLYKRKPRTSASEKGVLLS